MIPYFGLPITPVTACCVAINGAHVFISFADRSPCSTALPLVQSFALDNGAYSAWKSGNSIKDWSKYYKWVDKLRYHPSFDFAIIPDSVEGGEKENDKLLREWPFGNAGGPVWHLHESLGRLENLTKTNMRVCLGSSGPFSVIGTKRWWGRIAEAMSVVCDKAGKPKTKIHGLRMLDPRIVTRVPFSSADSTRIGRGLLDKYWPNGPESRDARAWVLRVRVESFQSPAVWDKTRLTTVGSGLGLLSYE